MQQLPRNPRWNPNGMISMILYIGYARSWDNPKCCNTKNVSMMSSPHRLMNEIRRIVSPLNSGKSTDVIYVDFAKAFDSVYHYKLLYKLIPYGFSGKLHAWISTWLSGRTKTVKLGSSFSTPKSDLSGILQGSVLGPLLFLIYINDLIDHLLPDSHPTLVADDLKLFSDTSPVFIPGSDSLVASRLLQSSLDHLLLWSSLWQLPIHQYLNVPYFLYLIPNFHVLVTI